jgi:hypothetical protein
MDEEEEADEGVSIAGASEVGGVAECMCCEMDAAFSEVGFGAASRRALREGADVGSMWFDEKSSAAGTSRHSVRRLCWAPFGSRARSWPGISNKVGLL